MDNWPEPNYTDPATHGQGIVIANIIFGVLVLVSIVLRVYSRVRITSSFGVDDIFILFATAVALTMYVVMSVGSARYGWNRHVWDIPRLDISTTKKLNLAFQVTFSLSSGLTKLSLLCFCRRLFGNTGKLAFNFHYIILTGTIFLVSACLVGFILILLLQCRPLKAYWDSKPAYHHNCLDGAEFIFTASILNTVTDFLCTLIPMTLVWKLHMNLRQKIAVAYVFGLGILINIAGAVRIYYYYQSTQITDGDMTWVGYPTYICSTIEIGLGLIVTSAPALRPLVSHYLPRLMSETSYRRGDSRTRPTNSRSTTRPGNQSGRFGSRSYLAPDHPVPLVNTQLYKGPRAFDGIRVTQTVELTAFYQNTEQNSFCGHYEGRPQ
ncbi:hypothetical protein ASPWEDRAFT_594015 [Aspergillus wentii DTO 134E9]|uniref:Rhodopsin domain-containing protein n=1 Tax=Aspergillus wentii DTO 134E9 TaxID=1073089 RepID=A0A1L9RD17_ASPWE|nr:uncharacterized protein ASPWEDRAFT_594015 [Aspergillus wentii DTO 134E9]OJJ32820.1 hypothetical protein ASPWEDRAFT_594015 [Aspergillus wentii DTO 134E9]